MVRSVPLSIYTSGLTLRHVRSYVHSVKEYPMVINENAALPPKKAALATFAIALLWATAIMAGHHFAPWQTEDEDSMAARIKHRPTVESADMKEFTTRAEAYEECVGAPGHASCETETQALHKAILQAESFDFAREASFDLHLYKGMLVVSSEHCPTDGMAGSYFAWNSWDAHNKEAGNFESFDDKGRVLGDYCLLSVKLPTDQIAKLSVQFLDNTKQDPFWQSFNLQ